MHSCDKQDYNQNYGNCAIYALVHSNSDMQAKRTAELAMPNDEHGIYAYRAVVVNFRIIAIKETLACSQKGDKGWHCLDKTSSAWARKSDREIETLFYLERALFVANVQFGNIGVVEAGDHIRIQIGTLRPRRVTATSRLGRKLLTQM